MPGRQSRPRFHDAHPDGYLVSDPANPRLLRPGRGGRGTHQHLGHEHARPLRPAVSRPARARAVAAAAQDRRGARSEAHRHQHGRHPMGGRRADPQPVQPARRQPAGALCRADAVGRAAGHALAGDADRRGDRHLRGGRAAGPRHHRRMLQPRGHHSRRDDHDRSGMVLLAAQRRSGRRHRVQAVLRCRSQQCAEGGSSARPIGPFVPAI